MGTASTRVWLKIAALGLVAGLCYYAALHPVDFPVYHQATRAMLKGQGPLYGPQSGLGWPMHFRYPPLFLLLFIPFALLPLKLGAGAWAALKFVVLDRLVRALASQLGWPGGREAWLVPLVVSGPYLVQEFRYGNAQFFIFALVAASLLWLRARPIAAAFALGLAASLKIWPLLFVPYLAARREWRVVLWTLLFTLGLTLLPAAYFGWGGNETLLRQWASQEFGTQFGAAQVWFPSQSLRGVLMRYLVEIDYSKLPDPNYRTVNLLALDPRSVRLLWLALATAGYVALLVLARNRAQSPGYTEHGLAFCALALLEPITHRIVLVVLLWPGMVAGAALATKGDLPRWARATLYAAVCLLALQPLVPGAASQRLFQVLGVDFLATCLVAAALAGASLQPGSSLPAE